MELWVFTLGVVLTIILSLLCSSVTYSKPKLNSTTSQNTAYDNVMQTHYALERIPHKVEENWRKYAKNVTRQVLDDTQCKSFLKLHYGQWAVDRFDAISEGAHKADLFRYAWLYKMGGIYADIKTVILDDISTIFADPKVCYLSVSKGTNRLFNGIIATPPNNPLMYKLFMGAATIKSDSEYWYNVLQGFEILESHLLEKPVPGFNKAVSSVPDVYIFEEQSMDLSDCEAPDRYGLCMFVRDKSRNLFKVRYPDYPW